MIHWDENRAKYRNNEGTIYTFFFFYPTYTFFFFLTLPLSLYISLTNFLYGLTRARARKASTPTSTHKKKQVHLFTVWRVLLVSFPYQIFLETKRQPLLSPIHFPTVQVSFSYYHWLTINWTRVNFTKPWFKWLKVVHIKYYHNH